MKVQEYKNMQAQHFCPYCKKPLEMRICTKFATTRIYAVPCSCEMARRVERLNKVNQV